MSEPFILQLEEVTAKGALTRVSDLTEMSLSIGAGDMLILEPERHVETVSFYDVASGLIAPDAGVVRFCGIDWQRMGFFQQSAARGRIGRIFEVEGWVSNLDIYENITLSQRHHTTISERELHVAVQELRERIGLRDCMAERPHLLSRSDLRRAQWVRAFLGDPVLLLLNAPLLDIRPDDQSVLFELIGEARSRGAAVVWKSRDALAQQGGQGLDGATRGRLSGGKLLLSDVREDGVDRRGAGMENER